MSHHGPYSHVHGLFSCRSLAPLHLPSSPFPHPPRLSVVVRAAHRAAPGLAEAQLLERWRQEALERRQSAIDLPPERRKNGDGERRRKVRTDGESLGKCGKSAWISLVCSETISFECNDVYFKLIHTKSCNIFLARFAR